MPPYDHAKLDPIMGFYCPSIQPTTNKADYDKRCVPGNQFCPGADTFQGKKGGGGCDFNAPFGPAACDQPGMHFVMNIKVCGAWPESVAPGESMHVCWRVCLTCVLTRLLTSLRALRLVNHAWHAHVCAVQHAAAARTPEPTRHMHMRAHRRLLLGGRRPR